MKNLEEPHRTVGGSFSLHPPPARAASRQRGLTGSLLTRASDGGKSTALRSRHGTAPFLGGAGCFRPEGGGSPPTPTAARASPLRPPSGPRGTCGDGRAGLPTGPRESLGKRRPARIRASPHACRLRLRHGREKAGPLRRCVEAETAPTWLRGRLTSGRPRGRPRRPPETRGRPRTSPKGYLP